MTGIVGGSIAGNGLREMIDPMQHEPWYEVERFEEGQYGFGLTHHGSRDQLGQTTWHGDGASGAIYGAVSNWDQLGLTPETLFERISKRPSTQLAELDGPFLLVYADADRILLATDKIGSRPCYYTIDDGLLFGSELKAILTQIDEPQIDQQAVSDMLLIGSLWGEKTLVDGIKALPPASFLEYSDEGVSIEQYWRCSFDAAEPSEQYIYKLIKEYERCVDRMAGTMSGTVGVWLSGGLDSRAMIAALEKTANTERNFDSLYAYTYDANPVGGGNPQLARRVADTLDITLEQIELSPETFVPVANKAVDIMDGMVRWNSLLNLTAVFNRTNRDPGVILEGAGQGELIGHHLRRCHFTNCSSVVDSMYQSEAALDEETVRNLLRIDVDPLDSFRKEAQRSEEQSFEGIVLDAHFRNYYYRHALASNHLPRSQAGTRVPIADGALLRHTAKLPLRYRMGTFPFTNGKIPYGATQPKIRMMRALDTELSKIPYERTSITPSRPFPLHVLGFVTSTAIKRLSGKQTYGGRGMVGEWYRREPLMQNFIDSLLDDACDRSLFNENTIRDAQKRHLNDEGDYTNIFSPVTTLEMWLQKYID